jgi:hypothetical protein
MEHRDRVVRRRTWPLALRSGWCSGVRRGVQVEGGDVAGLAEFVGGEGVEGVGEAVGVGFGGLEWRVRDECCVVDPMLLWRVCSCQPWPQVESCMAGDRDRC